MVTLVALDFDGVICDSCGELALVGLRILNRHYHTGVSLSASILSKFRSIRPVLEFGYEGIVLMYILLHFDMSEDEILNSYKPTLKDRAIGEVGLSVSELKGLLTFEREEWMRNDLESWLSAQELYPGSLDGIIRLSSNSNVILAVISTKVKQFVVQFLRHVGIKSSIMPDNLINGYDEVVSNSAGKSSILHQLIQQTACSRAIFVEDRLEMLLESGAYFSHYQECPVELVLAGWGYNTNEEKSAAAVNNIRVMLSWNEFNA